MSWFLPRPDQRRQDAPQDGDDDDVPRQEPMHVVVHVDSDNSARHEDDSDIGSSVVQPQQQVDEMNHPIGRIARPPPPIIAPHHRVALWPAWPRQPAPQDRPPRDQLPFLGLWMRNQQREDLRVNLERQHDREREVMQALQRNHARHMQREVDVLNRLLLLGNVSDHGPEPLDAMHHGMDGEPMLELQMDTERLFQRPDRYRYTVSDPQWPPTGTTDPFLQSFDVVEYMFFQEWEKERHQMVERLRQEQPRVANDDRPPPAVVHMLDADNHRQLPDRRDRIASIRYRRRRLLEVPPTNQRAFLHTRRVQWMAQINARLEAGAVREMQLARMLTQAMESSTDLLQIIVLIDDFGMDVNAAITPGGSTPLDWASRFDSRDQNYYKTAFLLLRGATVFDRDRSCFQNVLLHSINSTNDSMGLSEILLHLDVRVDTPDQEGVTPLWRALKSHNTPQALMLVRHSQVEELNRRYGKRQATILQLATESVSCELVSELLKRGASPLIADVDGKTPLMSACELHRFSMIMPICKSAKTNKHPVLRQQDKTGKFALHYIAIHVASPVDQQFEVMKYLLCNGNTFEDRCNEGKSILHYLCGSAAHQPLLARVLELKPETDLVRHVDKQGHTLLHNACIRMRGTKAEYLLDSWPALYHVKDKSGRTAIHATVCALARDGDRASLIQKLFERLEQNGGSPKDRLDLVNGADRFGWTPLHCACFYGLRRSALMLIKHGANIEVVDSRGMRPLHLACFSGVVMVPHVYGREQELVLQVFAGVHDKEVVEARFKADMSLSRALVHQGAEMCTPDFSGNLPWFVAAMFGQVQATCWGIQAGTSQGLFAGGTPGCNVKQ